MSGTATAIEVRSLRRVFEPRRGRARRGGAAVVALDGLSLRVPAGTVHGLLGPNGAGKTTLVKILSTVLLPTSGQAAVAGHDVVAEAAAVRRRIALVLGGDRGLYARLTARLNLRYWAALHGVAGREADRRVGALLDRLGLAERADEPVETFSRGMKQRVHLARALIADPAVLFLDEPTVGLDPVAAAEFRRLVGDLRAQGRTVLLTTHDMVEAETACDEVSFVDRGVLLATERPATVGTLLERYERVEVDDLSDRLADEIRRIAGVSSVDRLPDGRAVVRTEAEGATHRVLEHLVAAGCSSLRTGRPSLEEVYAHVVGDRGMRL